MSGIVESVSREAEAGELAGIQQINDTPAIYGITGKPVWMPCQQSFCFSNLNLFYHEVEDRPTRFLGGLCFDKLINDSKTFSRGILSQFMKLRFERKNLPVFIIGGFTGVDKVGWHGTLRRWTRIRLGSDRRRREENPAAQRAFLRAVGSNLALSNRTLCLSYKLPFSFLAENGSRTSWLRLADQLRTYFQGGVEEKQGRNLERAS